MHALREEDAPRWEAPESGLPAVVRERRSTLGLSQRALAQSAGISPSHVKGIERGRSRPSHPVIARLARALQMSEDELLSGQDREDFRSPRAPAPGLGERLRRQREERGLSIEQLAARTGLSAPFVGQMELGDARPSHRVARALAAALDLPLTQVVDGPLLARLRAEPAERTGFAEQLHRWRTARQLTQAALARLAGLDAHYVSVLERGRSQPSVEVATALATALSVSLQDLLGDREEGDLHAWHRPSTGLGRRLGERRQERGPSRAEVARRAGISTTALWRLEHEVVVPRRSLVCALAAALNVPIADLLP
ncbi:MAG: hypothetical protein NVSMB65_18090 [Chloroflexota bacterium]